MIPKQIQSETEFDSLKVKCWYFEEYSTAKKNNSEF